MQSKLENLLRDFLEYLETEKKRTPQTARNYDFYLQRFFNFAKISSPAEITLSKVTEFRQYLEELLVKGQPLKKSTQNYHIIALRSFIKYLAKKGIKVLALKKLKLEKTGERTVEFLTGSELEKILSAPAKVQAPAIIKLRDKAILEILFSTGLRVSELANLTLAEIKLNQLKFSVRSRGESRVVFMSHQARYVVSEYLKLRHDDNPYLFIGHDRGERSRTKSHQPKTDRPMAEDTSNKLNSNFNKQDAKGLTPRSVQRIVEKYARLAGIKKKVTPQTLRHSYAVDLLKNGANIKSVQSSLGNSSGSSTQMYVRVV